MTKSKREPVTGSSLSLERATAQLHKASPKASAILLDYTVSSLNAPRSPSADQYTVSAGPTPVLFSLNDGGSFDFVFFTIAPIPNPAGGSSINNVPFSATINFSDPAGPADNLASYPAVTFTGAFDDSTLGSPFINFNQTNQSINIPGNRAFAIDLITTIEGSPGLGSVFDLLTVTARVTQNSSTTPSVPDGGSTALLLGLALTSLAFARRRLIAHS